MPHPSPSYTRKRSQLVPRTGPEAECVVGGRAVTGTGGHDSACEDCVDFQTTIGFLPTLQTQHDDAAAKQQTD
jgi:hypothetical protein